MTEIRTAIDFYERHPISARIVVAKLEAEHGSLANIKPEHLWPHDQDHYGGLPANDALAVSAGLKVGMRVADFCAGLGGPARYMALKYNVEVTGIELTPSRVAGANELSLLVDLADRVRVLEGDVMAAPLADASQDVVLSQEAFLHVPDLPRTFAEAFRILKPGGVFAYTNWTAPGELSSADKRLLWDGMAVARLYSREDQKKMLECTGFRVNQTNDLSDQWRDILVKRLAMYRKLRQEAAEAGAPAGHDAFYDSYVLFVDLMQSGGLGGAHFVAIKD